MNFTILPEFWILFIISGISIIGGALIVSFFAAIEIENLNRTIKHLNRQLGTPERKTT